MTSPYDRTIWDVLLTLGALVWIAWPFVSIPLVLFAFLAPKRHQKKAFFLLPLILVAPTFLFTESMASGLEWMHELLRFAVYGFWFIYYLFIMTVQFDQRSD